MVCFEVTALTAATLTCTFCVSFIQIYLTANEMPGLINRAVNSINSNN